MVYMIYLYTYWRRKVYLGIRLGEGGGGVELVAKCPPPEKPKKPLYKKCVRNQRLPKKIFLSHLTKLNFEQYKERLEAQR